MLPRNSNYLPVILKYNASTAIGKAGLNSCPRVPILHWEIHWGTSSLHRVINSHFIQNGRWKKGDKGPKLLTIQLLICK